VRDRLAGKVALVTGAARGIGAATARWLAMEGATVALTDVLADSLESTTDEIRATGASARAWTLDVTRRDDVKRVVGEVVGAFGRIDILVSNAAVGKPMPFLETTDADLRRVLEVNLNGVFIVGQEVARMMTGQGGGRIVNVGSLAAHTGNDRQSAYAAAKGGVDALTRVMAFELAPHGISVNAVSPGPIETELAKNMLTAATRSAREVRVPLGRLGKPEEVAATIAYLASSDAAYVNGAVIVIDGGLLVGGIRDSAS
jgi:NAD(P)-dependent dehydrogenase (short-subunit alcohol dehydrogenase family)